MLITKEIKYELTISVEGRIDSETAAEFAAAIPEDLTDYAKLTFDLAKTEYISSAGLRVFLAAQKKMLVNGNRMVVTNVCRSVMEIFDITGFLDILTVE